MRITIRLLAGYRRYLPQGHDAHAGYPHQVPLGTTVGDVLATLPLPPNDLYTFFVNGLHATPDILKEGRKKGIRKPVAGTRR